MKLACQIVLVALMCLGFFMALKSDFHGKEAQKPGGFVGACLSVAIFALMFALYNEAGAFSELIGGSK